MAAAQAVAVAAKVRFPAGGRCAREKARGEGMHCSAKLRVGGREKLHAMHAMPHAMEESKCLMAG